MDSVDATDRQIAASNTPPPSLLAIIIDTNPIAWVDLQSALPLSKTLAHLQVFINAHLAVNPANRVAVLASHIDRAAWLYPTPVAQRSTQNGTANGDDKSEANGDNVENDTRGKYRPFLDAEQQLKSNLQKLVTATTPASLENADSSTQIAGALTSALTYINKATILSSPSGESGDPQYQLSGQTLADGTTTAASSALVSRVLIISVSGDLSSQYIAVMNSIFAAQRRHIPIDVLKLAGNVGFLQQACDATGGVYLELEKESMRGAGLLQYLMMAYLPDVTARRALVSPGSDEVDFRAACFCHRRVVDLGFVCSVCLSIFCEPLPDSICLTCGTTLELPTNWNVKPAVIPRKKKKRRRAPGEVSNAGTPMTSRTATPTPQ